MSIKLGHTSMAVLDCIREYRQTNGFTPSFREIMDIVGISSTSVVSYHIHKLHKYGYIQFNPKTARSAIPTPTVKELVVKLEQENFEEAFLTQTRWAGLPKPVREYKFHPTRKWRADFAWPKYKVIVECQGGIWTKGAHVRGTGYENDVQKHNAAIQLGWKVFWITTTMLESDPASFMEMLGEVMGVKTYE